MTTTVIRGGYDAHINSDHPNAPHPKAKNLILDFGESRGLLYMPLAGIRGRTVLSAELTGHAGPGGLPAGKTLTWAPLIEGWSAAEATWTNQPGLLGTGSATFDTGAGLAAGEEFAVDVGTALQSVSTGAAWFGWRVTINHTSPVQVRAFNAAATAWTLTVELSDVPAQPTMLSPNGSDVGRPKPVLSWDFTDLGAFNEQTHARVQIDPDADEVSPAFDSGMLPNKNPEFDTSTSAYAGLTAGASDMWRVLVRGESGQDAPWSDWAPFTYQPKPAITLLSPSAGVLWDPTAEILAAIAPATMEAFRIRVTSGTDRTDVLYDSYKQPATDPALVGFELPAKNRANTRILVDDSTYQLNLRVFDDKNREATTGDPIYAELWTTFHFDDDLSETPVSTTVAHQIRDTPNVRITWNRAETGDKWIVLRDGQIVATLLPEETVTGAGTYSWIDNSAAPHRRHVYTVKAIVNGKQTRPGPQAVITTAVGGLWVLSDFGDVRMQGNDVDGFRALDKRATYKMLRGPDVDIIHGFGGIAHDEVSFTIRNREDQTFEEAEAILLAIRANPTDPSRMVWGSKNIPVRFRNLLPLPSSDMQPADMRHRVAFGFWQVGEFGDDA